jgi:hypothetical protein
MPSNSATAAEYFAHETFPPARNARIAKVTQASTWRINLLPRNTDCEQQEAML